MALFGSANDVPKRTNAAKAKPLRRTSLFGGVPPSLQKPQNVELQPSPTRESIPTGVPSPQTETTCTEIPPPPPIAAPPTSVTPCAELSEDGEGRIPSRSMTKKTEGMAAKVGIDPRAEKRSVAELYPELPSDAVLVIGCDEAGRGPVVGPVSSAACLWIQGAQTDHLGLCDSKLVTKEDMRETLFAEVMDTPGLFWASVEFSPEAIDRMNILNAALCGMSLATSSVLDAFHSYWPKDDREDPASPCALAPMLPLCPGITVQSGVTNGTSDLIRKYLKDVGGKQKMLNSVAMLCDGDKVPRGARPGGAIEFKLIAEEGGEVPACGWLLNQWRSRDMGIKAKSCVKGDASHRSIATASIIAKVLRDRRMYEIASQCRESRTLWGTFVKTEEEESEPFEFRDTFEVSGDEGDDPYDLISNKGYPTKTQKAAVGRLGASEFHRLSFKPALDLLKKNELKMPCSMGPRALAMLQEIDRREALKLENKQRKQAAGRKRPRQSTGAEEFESIDTKRGRTSSGQTTLDMFRRKVSS